MSGKKKMNRASVIAIVAISVLILLGFVWLACVKLFGPVNTMVDLRIYLGLSKADEYALVINTEKSGKNALKLDDNVYLPLDVVVESIDERFFYDQSLGAILYAMPTSLMTIMPNEKSYSVDGNSIESYYEPFVVKGGEKYIAERFVAELSGAQINVYNDNSTVFVLAEPQSGELVLDTVGLLVSADDLRTQETKRSSIVRTVKKSERLFLIEKKEEWCRVLTQDGLLGYVETAAIDFDGGVFEVKNNRKYEYTSISMDEPVVLVWHQVTSNDYAAQIEVMKSRIDNTKVNVICPTWYSLASADGHFTTLASKEYADAAHEIGLSVWALIDNFDKEVDNLAFLNSYEARKTFINGIVGEVRKYGIDGINIDFEAGNTGYGCINKECSAGFMQLLRELSIECRRSGLVLSVDNYVPMSFNSYYDRAEQGKIVDYVIIMGYDEHYAGSDAGSVASYDFVKAGIENTLLEVPADKVINGIPFYTRLWKVDENGVVLGSEAKNMRAMAEMIAEAGASPIWDETVRQFYAEFIYEGVNYKVWLETAESVKWKIELINNNRLAGVACWKLGLETADIWSEVKLNGKN